MSERVTPLQAPLTGSQRANAGELPVASRGVASIRGDDSEMREQTQHYDQQQQANHDQLAHRVANIHGATHAEALWNNYRRIIGIVVQETCQPIPIIIAEYSGCIRFCPRTRSQQRWDERTAIKSPPMMSETMNPRFIPVFSFQNVWKYIDICTQVA